jgi:Skp family chaperone for outer membrane proteins
VSLGDTALQLLARTSAEAMLMHVRLLQKSVLLFLSLGTLFALFTTPCFSDVILVIDIKMLLEDSMVGKDVAAQIQKKRSEYAADILNQENTLRRERDILHQQQSTLSAEKYKQKESEWQQKVHQLDQVSEREHSVLVNANGTAFGEIQEALISIIRDTAKKRHAQLVIQKSDSVVFPSYLDITKETLDSINGQLPKLVVNFAEAP